MLRKKIKIFSIGNKIEQHGNWIDLSTSEEVVSHKPKIKYSKSNNQRFVNFEYLKINLGIITELPKWYKAELKPRSSTFEKYGLIQTNSIGEIEGDYGDFWLMPVLCFKDITIPENTRICQFQVKLREDAPIIYKILDLFTKLKIEMVDNKEALKSTRGGFGSTDGK